MKYGKGRNAVISLAVALATAALIPAFSALALEALPIEAATPTIATTDSAVSRGDIVPGDVQTLEDYQDELFTGGAGGDDAEFSIWRVLGSLAIVVALIVGVVYIMRLVMARGMRYDLKGRHIKVMDVVQLGMNRSLYLVSIGGKVILVGSSDKGLNFLADLSSEEELGESPGGFREEGGVEFQKNLETAVMDSMENTSPERSGVKDAGSFMEQLKGKLNRIDDEDRNA